MSAEAGSSDGPGNAAEATELERWRRFVATRDLELRNQIVEQNLGLARTLAATMYARRGGLAVDFADYLQFATLGLIEATDRYEPDRGVPFSAFAGVRIRGAILNSLEALSEHYQQLDLHKRLRQERLESIGGAKAAARKRDSFAALAEIAVDLALSHMLEGSSMLAPAGPATRGYTREFYDTAQERQLRDSIALLVHALPEQERRVVRYHYYQNLGFTEIAGLLGVGRSRVSQIHRQALALLRDARASVGPVDLGG